MDQPLLDLHIPLAVIALVCDLVFVWTISFRWNINRDAFWKAIVRLIQAKNLSRARKLCNAAPNAMFVKAMKPGMDLADGGGQPNLDALAGVTREALVTAEEAFLRWWAVAIVGGLLTCCGLLTGLELPWTHWSNILCLVGLFMLLFSARTLFLIQRHVREMPLLLLPMLVMETRGERVTEAEILAALGVSEA